jgi:uncharacterized membrane protein YvlD (DUF360 family)
MVNDFVSVVMIENVVRVYVVIGLACFALRGVLYELSIPIGPLLLGLLLVIILVYGINHLIFSARGVHVDWKDIRSFRFLRHRRLAG